MAVIEARPLCHACGQFHVFRDELCLECHNEVERIGREFSHFGDDAEDIGHGRLQQERIEKDWK